MHHLVYRRRGSHWVGGDTPYLLQWGLTFPARKRGLHRRAHRRLHAASMGPHSFERGNMCKAHSQARKRLASMGPHSFERGNLFETIKHVVLHTRFNGASLIRARKLAIFLSQIGITVELQWGLTHSSEETCTHYIPMTAHLCFNGASLIRARKLGEREGQKATKASFNGASLIRARKLERPLKA